MSLSVCRWQASIFSPGKPVFPSLSTSKVVTFRMSLSCALPTLQKTVCNYKCTGSWGFLPDHVVLCQVGGIMARRFHRFYYWLYCNWSCACLGCESLSTCLWVSQKKIIGPCIIELVSTWREGGSGASFYAILLMFSLL